jgi:hypothetical protein
VLTPHATGQPSVCDTLHLVRRLGPLRAYNGVAHVAYTPGVSPSATGWVELPQVAGEAALRLAPAPAPAGAAGGQLRVAVTGGHGVPGHIALGYHGGGHTGKGLCLCRPASGACWWAQAAADAAACEAVAGGGAALRGPVNPSPRLPSPANVQPATAAHLPLQGATRPGSNRNRSNPMRAELAAAEAAGWTAKISAMADEAGVFERVANARAAAGAAEAAVQAMTDTGGEHDRRLLGAKQAAARAGQSAQQAQAKAAAHAVARFLGAAAPLAPTQNGPGCVGCWTRLVERLSAAAVAASTAERAACARLPEPPSVSALGDEAGSTFPAATQLAGGALEAGPGHSAPSVAGAGQRVALGCGGVLESTDAALGDKRRADAIQAARAAAVAAEAAATAAVATARNSSTFRRPPRTRTRRRARLQRGLSPMRPTLRPPQLLPLVICRL